MKRLLSMLALVLVTTFSQAVCLLQTPPPPPPSPDSGGPGTAGVPIDSIVIYLAIISVFFLVHFYKKKISEVR